METLTAPLRVGKCLSGMGVFLLELESCPVVEMTLVCSSQPSQPSLVFLGPVCPSRHLEEIGSKRLRAEGVKGRFIVLLLGKP